MRETVLTRPFAGGLHIPLHVQQKGKQQRIGPAFGVYALAYSGSRPFGPQSQLFVDLAEICKGQGVDLFILTPGHLRQEKLATRGYRLYAGKQWREENTPWPDFLWRRATIRPARLAAVLDEDEACLRETTLHGALPRIDSDKWRLYEELYASVRVRPCLPATILLHQPHDVLNAVKRWGDVYVKPARGTQGQQIARISYHGGCYRQQNMRQTMSQVSDLILFWRRRFQGQEKYIAQETVRLMHTQKGEPFDVRYLIQATPQGEPVCTATVIKLAPPGAVTTNLHTGGRALTPERLEVELAQGNRARFYSGLEKGEELARAAFAHLSVGRAGLVELGVDMAIDQEGAPKLLEVNPCPGRRMLREISPELRRLSLTRVVEYAVFCTGF